MEKLEISVSPIGNQYNIAVFYGDTDEDLVIATISTDGPLSAKDYPALVSAFIRAVYSMDDELAIQRQKDDKPGEYNRYNAFCEKSKALSRIAIHGYTLESAKEFKVAELLEYDSSDEINGFSIGGVSMWIGPARRGELKNKVEALKAQNVATVAFAGQEIQVDAALAMIAYIESYAAQCSFVTEMHRDAINALDSIEAVEAYDFTTGYPQKLTF